MQITDSIYRRYDIEFRVLHKDVATYEFREYVDAEGRVLTPAEIDEIRYKDDYREDIEQDYPYHR